MADKIIRTQGEIESLYDETQKIMDSEGSKFPGMSYEEGIIATLNWLSGEEEDILE